MTFENFIYFLAGVLLLIDIYIVFFKMREK
jgi:hypothetical protein